MEGRQETKVVERTDRLKSEIDATDESGKARKVKSELFIGSGRRGGATKNTESGGGSWVRWTCRTKGKAYVAISPASVPV